MKSRFAWVAWIVVMSAVACRQGEQKYPRETPTSGTIHISVDESFRNVLEDQVKVFESSFPKAELVMHYKSEADCFRDLTTDSTRMIIVTRGLNKAEEQFYLDSFHFVPIYGKLAYDAIAVIVNPASKDTLFTMRQLAGLLSGADTSLQVVMDGVSATATVRYAIDSVLRGKPLGKKVTAARSSEGVIDYVAGNRKAIGFIGVGWIGNPEDPEQLKFLEKVRVASVRCDSCADKEYVQPYQLNIALKKYPMVRGLYYVLKEDFRGVGNNFVNFLQLERGQLIFRRDYLMPAKMSFEVRNMQITN